MDGFTEMEDRPDMRTIQNRVTFSRHGVTLLPRRFATTTAGKRADWFWDGGTRARLRYGETGRTKIHFNSGRPLVSSRLLHAALSRELRGRYLITDETPTYIEVDIAEPSDGV
jgi:hypothetical protein